MAFIYSSPLDYFKPSSHLCGLDYPISPFLKKKKTIVEFPKRYILISKKKLKWNGMFE